MWVFLTIYDWLHQSYSSKSFLIELPFHDYFLSCHLFSSFSLSTNFYSAKYTEPCVLCKVPYVASFKCILPVILKWLQKLLFLFLSLPSVDCHGCLLKAKMDARLRLRANPQSKQNKAAYRHSYEVSHSLNDENLFQCLRHLLFFTCIWTRSNGSCPRVGLSHMAERKGSFTARLSNVISPLHWQWLS